MRQRKAAGFTLMELMIAIAVMAILSSLALASYRSYIVRANRSAAESFMQEVAAKEERYLLDNRQYLFVADLSVSNALVTTPSDVSGNYVVKIEDNDTASAVPGYKITATPSVKQAAEDTDCLNLTLDSQGVKAQSGPDAAHRCWK